MIKYFLKKSIFVGIVFLLLSSCSKNDLTNDGFISYLYENRNNIFFHIVNEEATSEFDIIFRQYAEYIFDENGELIHDFTIPDDNIFLRWDNINNNFEKSFLGYFVLHREAIEIGKRIKRVESRIIDDFILVRCILDDEGRFMLYEFTSNNINRTIAMILNDKIIFVARVLGPVENSINFNVSL